jgi:organic hydroperoxide reductase OsmC/OhrA
MADIICSVEAVWLGTQLEANATFSAGSGAIPPQAVSWPARTGVPDGVTTPEEMIASRHASFHAMAFSAVLDHSDIDFTSALRHRSSSSHRRQAAASISAGPRSQHAVALPGLDQQRFECWPLGPTPAVLRTRSGSSRSVDVDVGGESLP